MSTIWNAETYDSERRRLVPCFDQFYGTAVELVACTVPPKPRILELGAGTGLLSGMLIERLRPSTLLLLDASTEMLARAGERLVNWQPIIAAQQLTDPLPAGPFHAAISALAIHHLDDGQKASLFGRIFEVLAPGGIFVNAEQILGLSDWHQRLYERVHLDSAQALGSSEVELAEAEQRMKQDRCATLSSQLGWLRESGYERVDCFFQWFRFAVYAGWKPAV
jgi:tRNA (cmo5U34)-methyltransferase